MSRLPTPAGGGRQQDKTLQYLVAENRVLKDQLKSRGRGSFTDKQRHVLAAKARELGRAALKKLDTEVAPDTLLRWHRQLGAKKYDGSVKRRPGRPRVVNEIEALIVRMATENRWGYLRIAGALASPPIGSPGMASQHGVGQRTRGTPSVRHGPDYLTITLRIQRLLPGPIERVWGYLTDSDLRRQWLAAGQMPLQVRAPFELVWRNDELTDPPGQRPPGFPDEQRMASHITALDPPRMLAFTWGNGGEVTFELVPQRDEVLPIVTHRGLPDRGNSLMVGAGWHMHLDILVARATGTESEPFWDGWSRLQREYDQRLPA